jgi:hypothetical protein
MSAALLPQVEGSMGPSSCHLEVSRARAVVEVWIPRGLMLRRVVLELVPQEMIRLDHTSLRNPRLERHNQQSHVDWAVCGKH